MFSPGGLKLDLSLKLRPQTGLKLLNCLLPGSECTRHRAAWSGQLRFNDSQKFESHCKFSHMVQCCLCGSGSASLHSLLSLSHSFSLPFCDSRCPSSASPSSPSEAQPSRRHLDSIRVQEITGREVITAFDSTGSFRCRHGRRRWLHSQTRVGQVDESRKPARITGEAKERTGRRSQARPWRASDVLHSRRSQTKSSKCKASVNWRKVSTTERSKHRVSRMWLVSPKRKNRWR